MSNFLIKATFYLRTHTFTHHSYIHKVLKNSKLRVRPDSVVSMGGVQCGHCSPVGETGTTLLHVPSNFMFCSLYKHNTT